MEERRQQYLEVVRKKKQKQNLAVGIIGGVIAVFIGYLGYERYEIIQINKLIRELDPYVEMADGRRGTSIEERLDFAQRAELSDDMKMPLSDPTYNFHLGKFPREALERALQSYKAK